MTTTHTIDPKKLLDHIDSTSVICKDGKQFVKELVTLLTGVELVEKKPKVEPAKGQVWRLSDGRILLLIGERRAVNMTDKVLMLDTWDDLLVGRLCDYLAPDLKTYLANGGTL